MKKVNVICFLNLVIAITIVFTCFFEPIVSAQIPGKVKNVIIFIPDGCSQSVQTLARWYKGAPLTLDAMNSGTIATFMADSVITDSASAATAFACGMKTSDGFIGVGPRIDTLLSVMAPIPDQVQYMPLANILEGAKLMGKSTGIVSTSRVSHATPAAFACHVYNRGLEAEIMEQMVYENVDVVFGGGKNLLLPSDQGGERTDGEDLLKVLLDKGYQFVETRDELLRVNSAKVWGLFASSHMQADIDRSEFAPLEPSLSEMTSKAIEILSKDQDGFILIVEGSQVDWGDHANDPIYAVTDFLAFDEAVKVGKAFTDKNGETLILAFPDHDTGSMSIGNNYFSKAYTATSVEDLVNPLKGMKITSTGLTMKIGSNLNANNIVSNLQRWWGIMANNNDANQIIALHNSGEPLNYAICETINKNYTAIGWTTHGHNGIDVPLWSYGTSRPVGHFDNTDFARIVADAFGFDLAQINFMLFFDVDKYFPGSYVIEKTDPANPVLRLFGAEMPLSKNIIRIKGNTYEMEGLVVYAPVTNRIYIPYQAIYYILLNMGM
jgi:alkaline phosphatase